MPAWIKASLMFFAAVAFGLGASFAIAWGMNQSVMWTGVAMCGTVLVGAPTFFYFMLR